MTAARHGRNRSTCQACGTSGQHRYDARPDRRMETKEERIMLTVEDAQLIMRTGPGTPMGELIRRTWIPACLSEELPEPDCDPIRVRLLGEDLVAFRDSQGRVGIMEERCPHRQASLFFGRNEEGGVRCLY